MPPPNPNMRLVRTESFSSRSWGDRIVLLDVGDADVLYPLNDTGTMVWRWIGEGLRVGEMAERLAKEFGLSQETARQDVLAFIHVLQEIGAIDKTEAT